MALADHGSGQVFRKAVLWFGRDVPNRVLGMKPIVSRKRVWKAEVDPAP